MSDHEIELKLRVRPDDLPRLADAPVLAVAGKAVTRPLESVYYDTPDRRLRAAALTLRVRRQGRRFVQTVKAAPQPGGALVRPEWEVPVAGIRPDLTLVPPEAGFDRLGLTDAELAPVFATHIRRTTRELSRGGAVIELAFDCGDIRTPGGSVLPIHEIELELKQGADTAPVYELALALNEVAPVRLEMRSKAARGHDLAEGAGLGSSRAGHLKLALETTQEEALGAVVHHCLDHLLANEACAMAGTDPEGIHQMRVALRRLRSGLAIFRDVIPPHQFAELDGELRWLAGSFGPARDWDVFLESLYRPVLEALGPTPPLAALGSAARGARDGAYVVAREALLARRYTTLLLRLAAWADGRRWRDGGAGELAAPLAEAAPRLLARRQRQVRRRGRHFAELPAPERHRVRIALKKLRYAADFFRSLYDSRDVRRFSEPVAALQDALGHLNDVETVQRLMAELQQAGQPGDWREGAGLVVGWHARGAADQEPALHKAWKAFRAADPFWPAPPRRKATDTNGETE
jgi:inorganic triphosphatase YgiF